MNTKFSRKLVCRIYEGNIVEIVEQEVKLYAMKCKQQVNSHGNRESAGGGCEAAVTA